MDIREDLVAKFGGEVVQPQEQSNVIDLSGSNQEQENISPQEGEESSLNTEEPSQGEGQQSEGVEIGDEQVFNYLSEKLGRDITSYDDFENNEQSSPESLNFASEQLEVINKYVEETGRSVQDYLNTQTVDLSSLSDDVIMKEYLKLENPDLTEAELSDYMADTYKLDKDEYNQRETNVGKVQLTKDARSARDYFNKIKDEYAMPMPSEGDSGLSVEERNEWLSSMESSVDDMEGLSFDINDSGETFTYNLDAEALGDIKSQNSNLEGFFDKYIGEGGNWDFDKLNTDMYILNNIDKIVRGVANQYRSKGTEGVLNDIKNPSFNQDRQSAPQNKESTLDMLRRQILG